MAAARRAGAPETEPVHPAEPQADRRAAARAIGPSTSDTDRDKAYRQGQGAARRALDERRPLRRTHGPAHVHADPELQDIYAQGHHDTVHEARRTARQKATKRVLSSPAGSTTKTVANDGAGFVLGLIGYALLRNYLTGGWTGVQQWLAAKFINKTGPSSSAPPKESTPPYLPPPGSKPHVPVVVPPIFKAHPGQTEPPLTP